MEIWLGNLSEKTNNVTYSLDLDNIFSFDRNKIGLISFADIDNNGFMDMIYPINSLNSSQIGINYNKIMFRDNFTWDDNYCQTYYKQTDIQAKIFDPIGEKDKDRQVEIITLLDDMVFFSNQTYPVFQQIRVGIVMVNFRRCRL